jgi:hypothetical protein
MVGELELPSGTLQLADPSNILAPMKVEGIPSGRHPVYALIIRYPEGGIRVAQLGLRFRPGSVHISRVLGTVHVDSGTLVAIDAATYESHWREVGPDRVGVTGSPKDHRRVARLIERRFGLTAHEVNVLSSRFDEPISEELEEQITAYLKTLPEYAEFTFMYFGVLTGNTAERVQDAMEGKLWAEVPLAASSGPGLLAVASSFGDGSYPVHGLFGQNHLLGIEIKFIGPAQDKVLKAFPMLRY